ncbi:V-type ATP synthase subunit E [Patescibacteria group bacterium]|nr:V-type ATP synthase subunit E [Patescibacteria group bacterium]
MALQDILEQIESETQEKLDAIQAEHETALKKLDNEFAVLAKKTEQEMDEKVTENSGKIMNKMTTHARMEAKTKLLHEKREIMDKVFADALESLLSSGNYEDNLVNLLKNSDMEGDDVTIIPAKGKEDITKSALKTSGKPYTMSNKTADIKGGFILQSEKIEINNSFESILDNQLRGYLELEVAKTLFPA